MTHSPRAASRPINGLVAVLLNSAAPLALSGALALVPALTQAQESRLAIPAGPLADGLRLLGAQAGLQVSFLPQDMAGLSGPGLNGAYSADAALRQLLTGTGLDYAAEGAGSYRIFRPVPVEALGAADFVLGPVTVLGVSGGQIASYETPGAVSHIDAETIQAYRGSNPADLFRGTPGVMSGEARNGGAGVDVNIRGMQGFGRVATTVDGAENGVTIYQGYQGMSNRTFVDPDLIAEVDIQRGSDVASRGIAGGVAMRTLSADDLVAPGENMGFRLRAEVGGNTSRPEAGAVGGYAWPLRPTDPGVAVPSEQGMDRPGALTPTAGSFSIAGAIREDDFDLLIAYAARRQGNYHAGEDGPGAEPISMGYQEFCTSYCTVWPDYVENGGLSNYRLGEEVLNTELATETLLFKGTRRWGDGQSLQFGLTSYASTAGDTLASLLTGERGQPVQEEAGSRIGVNTATLRYRWDPSDNDLVNLSANIWASQLQQRNPPRNRYSTAIPGIENRGTGSDAVMWGMDIANRSDFDLGDNGRLALTYGLSWLSEDSTPYLYTNYREGWGGSTYRDGDRQEIGAHVTAAWTPVEELTVTGGLRWAGYRSEDRRLLDESVMGFDRDPVREDAALSPSLGVVYEPWADTQLYANWSRVSRFPSLFEAMTVSGNTMLDLPDVAPERAENIEIGVNHIHDGLFAAGDTAMVKFGYFNWDIDNYLSRQWRDYPTDDPEVTFASMEILNIDRARFEGIELSAGYRNGGFSADLAANYFLGAEFCFEGVCADKTLYADYATNHIPPEYALDLTVSQTFLDDRLTLGGRVSRVGPRAIGHGQVTATGASQFISQIGWRPYTLVDLNADYKINDATTLSLRIENVTDQYYIDPLGLVNQPGPGRSVHLGVTQALGGQRDLPRILSGEFTPRRGPADFSGLQAGIWGGRNFIDASGEITALNGGDSAGAADESYDISFDGAGVGGRLGYNWQFDSGLVLGVGAELGRGNARGESVQLAREGHLAGSDNIESIQRLDIDWTAGVNARAGYAFDNGLMVFGQAGLARSGMTFSRDQFAAQQGDHNDPLGPPNGVTSAFSVERISATRDGVTIGLGAEYALNANWSVWADYTHTQYRRRNVDFATASEGVGRGYDTWSVVGKEMREYPADPFFCMMFGYACEPYTMEADVWGSVHHEGSVERVNGRDMWSETATDGIRIGVNYRF